MKIGTVLAWGVGLFVLYIVVDWYEMQSAMTAAAGVTTPTSSVANNGPAVAVTPPAPVPATSVYPVVVRK
jgi:hypothetical protein